MSVMTRAERLALLLGDKPAPKTQASKITDEKQTPSLGGKWFKPSDAEALKDALAPLTQCFGGLLKKTKIPALKPASKGADVAEPIGFGSFAEMLSTVHPTDAHLQTVWSPSVCEEYEDGPRRLSKEALSAYASQVDVLVWDWDTPDHDEWTDQDFEKVVSKYSQHPMLAGAVWYRTRGGLRALRPLASPVKLDKSRGEDWSAFYDHILAQLPKINGLSFDVACSDATRLFRLPWVTRAKDKKARTYEAQEGLVYVPPVIEPYVVTAEDRAVMASALLPRVGKGEGVRGLVSVYKEIGWLGAQQGELNGHPKHLARCPWAHLHSGDTGKGEDDSCVLFANEEGEYTLHCLHASCKPHREAGGWRRKLQAEHSEAWLKHCGSEATQELFAPLDYNGFLEASLRVLRRAFGGELFQRGGEIVRLEVVDNEVSWHVWGSDYLTGELNRATQWMTEYTDKEGRTALRRAVIPKTIVQQTIEAIRMRLDHVEGRSILPLIDPVTMAPTRLSRGYCEQTRTYLYPQHDLDLDALAQVAQKVPSIKEAKDALSRLFDLYLDFPWQRKEHKLLAAAATFTAALRRSIDGPAPLFMVNANSKGVGKTKLAQAVLASIYGHLPQLSAVPERPEELKKMLDSLLLADSDYLVLDNIRGGIGDAQFDAFVTSDRQQSRILGKSKMFRAKNRVFLIGTGNNASLRADTDRRTLLMRLVTDLEHPEERKGFRYHDLAGEASTRATETWCDVLTILRAYHHHATAAQRDDLNQRGRNFGSFEVWTEWVRNPLMWLGEQVFEDAPTCDVVAMSSAEMESARGDDTGDLFGLLAEWQVARDTLERRKGAEWSPTDLAQALSAAQRDDAGEDYLVELAGLFNSLKPRYVGRVLSANRDKVQAGRRLTSRRAKRGMLYVLEDVGEPETPDGGDTPPTPTPKKPEWAECDIARPHDVKAEAGAQFGVLTSRCAWLGGGGMCTKERMPCEYPDAHGELSDGEAESLMRRYDAALVQISEPKPSAPPPPAPQLTLTLNEGVSPVVALVTAEMAVGSTRAQIVERLEAEGIAPPVGKRKWTTDSVSKIVKAHGITKGKKPTKERDRVAEFIAKLGGSWAGYYPEDHPHSHVHCDGSEPKAIRPNEPSGQVIVPVSDLLMSAVGYATTPQSLLANRPKRDEEDK